MRASQACGKYDIIHGLAVGDTGGLLTTSFLGAHPFEKGELITMMIKCE